LGRPAGKGKKIMILARSPVRMGKKQNEKKEKSSGSNLNAIVEKRFLGGHLGSGVHDPLQEGGDGKGERSRQMVADMGGRVS